MKIITKTKLISGGNPALVAAATTVTAVATVAQNFEYYVNAGERLGEKLYNQNHPDDGLGKMVYTKDDFKHPNWYLPAHEHPNNFNSGNFHNTFGGF